MYWRAATLARCGRLVPWGASAALLVVLTGCAGAGPGSAPLSVAPTPAWSAVAVPQGGTTLAALGFRNGPVQFVTLPAGVRPGMAVDQPNMVTVQFEVSGPLDRPATAPAPDTVARWLRTHLPDNGFRVVAGSETAVVFEGHGWQGAFTYSATTSALTLRRSA